MLHFFHIILGITSESHQLLPDTYDGFFSLLSNNKYKCFSLLYKSYIWGTSEKCPDPLEFGQAPSMYLDEKTIKIVWMLVSIFTNSSYEALKAPYLHDNNFSSQNDIDSLLIKNIFYFRYVLTTSYIRILAAISFISRFLISLPSFQSNSICNTLWNCII